MAPAFAESIETGPFGIMFLNHNTAMGIRGHSHYAEVTLRWDSLGPIGFPAFEGTYHAIAARLREATARPFRDATNEAVARALFGTLDDLGAQLNGTRGSSFRLGSLELAVRGVPDDIGHADGFTRYRVARPPET